MSCYFSLPILNKSIHGFFGKKDQTGRSLNVSSRWVEETEAINNRRCVQTYVGAEGKQLCVPNQIHSSSVQIISGPEEPMPSVDGLITDNPSCLLGVLTADCAPVLMAGNGWVAALHIGWRGALHGIVDTALDSIQGNYSLDDVCVGIGPCIIQENYSVSALWVDNFMSLHSDSDEFIMQTQSPLSYFFDLAGFVEKQFVRRGINAIQRVHYDTYENPDLFFSWRRYSHGRTTSMGNQLSVIGIKES